MKSGKNLYEVCGFLAGTLLQELSPGAFHTLSDTQVLGLESTASQVPHSVPGENQPPSESWNT